MRKYLYIYSVSLQDFLQRRWTLAVDRLRSLIVIVALYYLWSALLAKDSTILGYTRPQMLTYVLGLSLLRAFVLTSRAWETVGEIAGGQIVSYLLRPISYYGYCLAKDLAWKTVYVVSAVFEVGLLILVLRAPVYLPSDPAAWLLAAAATVLALLIYFALGMTVCLAAFWTSESSGPLFCFELALSFCAGAFFPLDVLPPFWQGLLKLLPFPYLAFFPLEVYLGRWGPTADVLRGLAIQVFWIGTIFALSRAIWSRGLKAYAAEGG